MPVDGKKNPKIKQKHNESVNMEIIKCVKVKLDCDYYSSFDCFCTVSTTNFVFLFKTTYNLYFNNSSSNSLIENAKSMYVNGDGEVISRYVVLLNWINKC